MSHRPSLTFLCLTAGLRLSSKCCALLLFFLVHREEPVPNIQFCVFILLFSAFKSYKYVLSVFKNRWKTGGLLMCCCFSLSFFCALPRLNFLYFDDFQLGVTTRQSSLPNAVVRQSGERLAPRLPVKSITMTMCAGLFLFVCFEYNLG